MSIDHQIVCQKVDGNLDVWYLKASTHTRGALKIRTAKARTRRSRTTGCHPLLNRDCRTGPNSPIELQCYSSFSIYLARLSTSLSEAIEMRKIHDGENQSLALDQADRPSQ